MKATTKKKRPSARDELSEGDKIIKSISALRDVGRMLKRARPGLPDLGGLDHFVSQADDYVALALQRLRLAAGRAKEGSPMFDEPMPPIETFPVIPGAESKIVVDDGEDDD